MSIEDRRKWNDDLRRIRSINHNTPGHEWMRGEPPVSSKRDVATDPSKLNLNNPQEFLEFLQALLQGETRSQDFLAKIPTKRLTELKEMYPQFSGFFFY
jgi:hypothetical protein